MTAMGLDSVEQAITDIKSGRPVIVVANESPASEGHLTFAAQTATTELLAFTVRHTCGYIRVPITQAQAQRLCLRPMWASTGREDETTDTVTVDARDGIGTGVSAADRAHTIRLLSDPIANAAEFTRPGHVAPLVVRPHGVLGRPAPGEAAVDLAVLAGWQPVAVTCEIVSQKNPVDVARIEELRGFAKSHHLKLISAVDLAAYRRSHESMVTKMAEAQLPLRQGEFTAIGYRSRFDSREYIALTFGAISDGEDIGVYLHSECVTGDVLGSIRCDCRRELDSALASVTKEGRGVVIYISFGASLAVGLRDEPRHYPPCDLSSGTHDRRPFVKGVCYDAATQILVDLGVKSMRLLSTKSDSQAGTSLVLADHLARRQ